MPMRRFKVLLERDHEAGAWVTYVPALGHLSTFGQTRAEALENKRVLPIGTLGSILRQAGLTADEFMRLLRA